MLNLPISLKFEKKRLGQVHQGGKDGYLLTGHLLGCSLPMTRPHTAIANVNTKAE